MMTQEKCALGLNGMVASARHEATKIGIDIIKKGGNAVDAAVAVGFALDVCEPNATNIGGGGFMLIRNQESDENVFIDFRETAPSKAHPDMWLKKNGELNHKEKAEGGKSVCIPGEVAGLLYAHQMYGCLDIDTVIQPSIDLALEGVVITESFFNDLKSNRDKIKRYLEPGNVYYGEFKIGQKLKNYDLAVTLEKIKNEGRDGFYNGQLADRIVSSVNKHGGVFSIKDLQDYEVSKRNVVKGTYRGIDVISAPLSSSGGTHVIQALNILECFDLSAYEVNSAAYIHLLSEIFKICFADRQEYMGDPDYIEVPIKSLISKSYAQKLSRKIDECKAQSYCYDCPCDDEPTDTTHYSIVDHEGNMVAVTKTICAFFGSGIVPEHTGIVLNCQTQGFVTGHGKKNSIESGKRPLSSMSPTMLLKEGEPLAVLGSPGGNRIISTVVQIIIKIVDYGMTMEEAIASPRISNDMTELLLIEGGIEQEVVKMLKSMGHKIKTFSPHNRKFGGVQGVRFREDRSLEGVADPRRDGASKGY